MKTYKAKDLLWKHRRSFYICYPCRHKAGKQPRQ
nr:MAG TPA: acid-sensing ion channel protein [Caudoviricetes sp.]